MPLVRQDRLICRRETLRPRDRLARSTWLDRRAVRRDNTPSMSGQTLRVVAPSRLHFGLLALGDACQRRFGGVGAMIERPGVDIRVSRHRGLSTPGPLGQRVRDLVRRWCQWHQLPHQPNCRIDILSIPSLHIGLGVGTQLALAIASGLNRFERDDDRASVVELAQSTGRGQRSAVGTLGFEQGGLVSERGKLADEAISKLDCRVPLPASWRFVLLCPPGAGLHGRREEAAFSQLKPIPPEVSRRLAAEIRDCMLPAAQSGQFDQFSASVYRYGHTAGLCFADVQGGAYNGANVTRLVSQIRAAGTKGVAQSSWGPTLFALAPDQAAAESLVDHLRRRGNLAGAEVIISPPNNTGAHCFWETSPS